MPNGYSCHKDQLDSAQPTAKQVDELLVALESAFANHIEERQTAYVLFDQMTIDDLADAFYKYPSIIKAVLACVNVASRAIARDLGITQDTYASRIKRDRAAALAGYIKPLLPRELALPALAELDRYFWADKEMRALKGAWEKKVQIALNTQGTVAFSKTKFKENNEEFELDAAAFDNDGIILVGVDVKRIESPRDIHKRSDEIRGKADNFKAVYPNGSFFAVIYYPFPSEHNNVISRLQCKTIDGIFFATETEFSISQAAGYLLAKAGYLKPSQ